MDQNQSTFAMIAELEQDFIDCLSMTGANDAFVQDMLPAVLVALSGGADSVFLLRGLASIYQQYQSLSRLSACHIDHNVRQGSAEDARFCHALCAELGVAYHERVLSGDRADESTLRTLRYEALTQVCQSEAIPYIVTAHHLDDQVETVLFRLLRGTSPEGASGIKSVRQRGPVILLRPLLKMRRAAIIAALEGMGAGFREDPSNDDRRYARNYLRHDVLPALNARFACASQNIEHFRSMLAEDMDFIEGELAARSPAVYDAERSTIDVKAFAGLPPALQGRLLVRWLADAAIDSDFATIERLKRLLRGEVGDQSVKNDILVSISKGYATLVPVESESKSASFDVNYATPVAVPAKGTRTIIVPWLGCALKITCLTDGSYGQEQVRALGCEATRNIFEEYLEISPETSFELRLRRPGDRFQPLGGDHAMRLKKYLHGQGGALNPVLTRLQAHFRGSPLGNCRAEHLLRHLPLLASADEVVWVPGLGISEKVRVRARANCKLELIQLDQHPDKHESGPVVTC